MNSDKILFFIFLLLFGCSSEHKKNTATQDWIGKSSSVLDLLDIKPIYISFCEEGEAVYGHVYNVKKKKILWLTMYIKNRRNSSKIKAFGSYQTLCLTESLGLRNRLLFIY